MILQQQQHNNMNVMSRTIERIFDDAQNTGELMLSNRKLDHYPQQSTKYDLTDTMLIDISKNHFAEIPVDICVSGELLEVLNCYDNSIRSIPAPFASLSSLVTLNLSCNQLSKIPSEICELRSLQVLLLSNNRLQTVGEGIARLQQLMYLDISCNEIRSLPKQIGDLTHLKRLNVRRNLLESLPEAISGLTLEAFDCSCNCITHLPLSLHSMASLDTLVVTDNPLQVPPAQICTRGRVHIMSYLRREAGQRKHGGSFNNRSPYQKSNKDSPRFKRNASQHATTKLVERNTWSPNNSGEIANSATKSSTTGDPSLSSTGISTTPTTGPTSNLSNSTNDSLYKPRPARSVYNCVSKQEAGYAAPTTSAASTAPSNLMHHSTVVPGYNVMPPARPVNSTNSTTTKPPPPFSTFSHAGGPPDSASNPVQRSSPDNQYPARVPSYASREQTPPSGQYTANHDPNLHHHYHQQPLPSNPDPSNPAHRQRKTSLDGLYGLDKRSPSPRGVPAAIPVFPSSTAPSTTSTRPSSCSSYSPPCYSCDSSLDYSYGDTSTNHLSRPRTKSINSSTETLLPSSAGVNPGPMFCPPAGAGVGAKGGANGAGGGGGGDNYDEYPLIPPPPPSSSPPRTLTRRPHTNNSGGAGSRSSRPINSAYSCNTPTTAANSSPSSTTTATSFKLSSSSSLVGRSFEDNELQRQRNEYESLKLSAAKQRLDNDEKIRLNSTRVGVSSRVTPPPVHHVTPMQSSDADSCRRTAIRLQEARDRVDAGYKTTSSSASSQPASSQPNAKTNRLSSSSFSVRSSVSAYSSPSDSTVGVKRQMSDSRQSTRPRQMSSYSPDTANLSNNDKRYQNSSQINPSNETGQKVDSTRTSNNRSTTSFTMRRQQQIEEDQKLRLITLRQTLEHQLSMTLPSDLVSSLRDGVLLCRFINKIRPHTVTTVHLPTSSNVLLSQAKSRRNVESFLIACESMGVPTQSLCNTTISDDNLLPLSNTVSTLLSCLRSKQSPAIVPASSSSSSPMSASKSISSPQTRV